MNADLELFFDAFFKLDSQGRFLSTQGKTSELFPTTEGGLLGCVLWEAFPELSGGELEQKIQAAVRQGKALRISGSLLPKAGWVEITIRPVSDGVECYVRDVSSYRQTQAGHAQDEKSRIIFDALLEHIPEAIIIADAGGPPYHYSFMVISHYATEILGLPRETLLQFTLADLLEHVDFFESGSDTPTSLENHPLSRFIERGESVEDLEYDLQNVNGVRTTISIKGGPIRNQDGENIGGILSWMDVSERKRQQEILVKNAKRLEQSNRDLEAFAYTASHDLQEPLRKVKNFSELLQQKYSTLMDEEGLDMLDRIRSAASRMQSLIKDLLAYSRLNTEEADRTHVDLNSILHEVISDLEVTITGKAGKVEVGPLPVVYANPLLMQQLFLNLVSNGLKFHSPGSGPQVRVYATRQTNLGSQGWVTIAVEDNGIGFEMDHFEKILQPFQRLHGRASYEGSGIGLAICRRIVEQLGGNLTAVSSPGRGSTFLVTLPQFPLEEERPTSLPMG